MRKALDYMENFNRYASEDATQAVERYLLKTNFEADL